MKYEDGWRWNVMIRTRAGCGRDSVSQAAIRHGTQHVREPDAAVGKLARRPARMISVRAAWPRMERSTCGQSGDQVKVHEREKRVNGDLLYHCFHLR